MEEASRRMGTVSLTAVFTLQLLSMAAARDYTLCIGEFDEKCPVAHNVFGGCGSKPDAIADSTCAIRFQGQVTSIPYRIIHRGSHDGNRCGYEWYLIECLEDVRPPSVQPTPR
jgi:hypothetical protein